MRFLMFVVAFSLALSPVLGLVPADFAEPQVVEKPLVFTPGEPVEVSIYNGGHEVWSDLAVSVGGSDPVFFRDVLGPERMASVEAPVPVVYALQSYDLSVTLSYDGVVLDERSLPVVVEWPDASAVADPEAPAGPELLLLMDADAFGGLSHGVQAEVEVLRGGEVVWFDFYGPFYLAPGEEFLWRTGLPSSLGPGDYTLRASFFEGSRFLARSEQRFSLDDGSHSLGPLLVVLLTLLFLVGLYLLLDSLYNRHSVRTAFRRLGP